MALAAKYDFAREISAESAENSCFRAGSYYFLLPKRASHFSLDFIIAICYNENISKIQYNKTTKKRKGDYAKLSISGKKALVLGSGGASNTVCAVLKQLNANVIIVSRSGENNYDNIQKHFDAKLIVNTTPVGMYPQNGQSPIDLSAFPHLECVMDLIYNPLKTKLLLDAETLGIPAYNGLCTS